MNLGLGTIIVIKPVQEQGFKTCNISFPVTSISFFVCLSLHPHRVSTYSLEYEDGTPATDEFGEVYGFPQKVIITQGRYSVLS